jgi:hypothetical protein
LCDVTAGPAKHKPILLPTGVILAGASTESGRASEKRLWQCWIDYSEDGGRSWRRHGPIPFDGNIIQPSLWIGDDMSVHMLVREGTQAQNLTLCWSNAIDVYFRDFSENAPHFSGIVYLFLVVIRRARRRTTTPKGAGRTR